MKLHKQQVAVIQIVDDTPANLSILFDLLGVENY